MNELRSLHDEAMDLAESAALSKMRKNEEEASRLFRKAFELEREAALLCADDLDLEPTRSVLLRSAASLAMDCGELREAERLISLALSGNPPEEIAEELRDLLEQVNFDRHLALRDLSLSPDELQLAIAGKSIGHGIAPSEEYVDRIQAFEKLVYRTAERRMNIDYRERGGPEKDVKDDFEVFVTVPRAASMAVTLRIGRATHEHQNLLPFAQRVEAKEVIDEIIYCWEALDHDKEALRAHIPDPAYYNNFLALSKIIAPDGENVSLVGLTVSRSGNPRTVKLSKTAKELSARAGFALMRIVPDGNANGIVESKLIEVKGTLKFADETADEAGKIKLIGIEGAEYTIIVPKGMMRDIVRPLWGVEVSVEGVKSEQGIELSNIERVKRKKSFGNGTSIRP